MAVGCVVVGDLVVAGDGGFGVCSHRERERKRERERIDTNK